MVTKIENDVLPSNPCILKFSATWCVPCKNIAPKYEELSNTSKVPFYEVDVEDNPDLTEQFSVHSVPTFIYITNDGTTLKPQGFDELKQLLAKH